MTEAQALALRLYMGDQVDDCSLCYDGRVVCRSCDGAGDSQDPDRDVCDECGGQGWDWCTCTAGERGQKREAEQRAKGLTTQRVTFSRAR